MASATFNNSREVCCVPSAIEADAPCRPGEPPYIGADDINEALFRHWRLEIPTDGSVTLGRQVNITADTGYYYLYVLNCDPDTTAYVEGHVLWKNPYGYLSGEASSARALSSSHSGGGARSL